MGSHHSHWDWIHMLHVWDQALTFIHDCECFFSQWFLFAFVIFHYQTDRIVFIIPPTTFPATSSNTYIQSMNIINIPQIRQQTQSILLPCCWFQIATPFIAPFCDSLSPVCCDTSPHTDNNKPTFLTILSPDRYQWSQCGWRIVRTNDIYDLHVQFIEPRSMEEMVFINMLSFNHGADTRRCFQRPLPLPTLQAPTERWRQIHSNTAHHQPTHRMIPTWLLSLSPHAILCQYPNYSNPFTHNIIHRFMHHLSLFSVKLLSNLHQWSPLIDLAHLKTADNSCKWDFLQIMADLTIGWFRWSELNQFHCTIFVIDIGFIFNSSWSRQIQQAVPFHPKINSGCPFQVLSSFLVSHPGLIRSIFDPSAWLKC